MRMLPEELNIPQSFLLFLKNKINLVSLSSYFPQFFFALVPASELFVCQGWRKRPQNFLVGRLRCFFGNVRSAATLFFYKASLHCPKSNEQFPHQKRNVTMKTK